MKKITVFIADSNGGYPVPATKGGAVTTLVEHLIKENSNNGNIEMNIVSLYDKEAEIVSKKYKNLVMTWVKPPKVISFFDRCFFYIFKKLFKNKKAISYKTIFSLIYYIFKSSFILRKNDSDLVVIENNVLLSWIIRLSKYNNKFYYHFHNIPRFDAFNKKTFRRCSKFICVSKFVADNLISDNSSIGKIDNNKVEVLYNCIDVHQFYPLSKEDRNRIRIEKGFSIDDFIILFVGRLSEEKGVDKIIEAFKRIKKSNCKLLITGSVIHNMKFKDVYVERLKELSADCSNKIYFTGYIPMDDLVYYYNMSNLVILPSMWEEPAGLTMIETIACGVPLITTYSGGIPEYVSQHCILIEREDIVDNIEKAINDVMNDGYKINIDKGIEVVKKEFNLQVYYKNFCKIINGDL